MDGGKEKVRGKTGPGFCWPLDMLLSGPWPLCATLFTHTKAFCPNSCLHIHYTVRQPTLGVEILTELPPFVYESAETAEVALHTHERRKGRTLTRKQPTNIGSNTEAQIQTKPYTHTLTHIYTYTHRPHLSKTQIHPLSSYILKRTLLPLCMHRLRKMSQVSSLTGAWICIFLHSEWHSIRALLGCYNDSLSIFKAVLACSRRVLVLTYHSRVVLCRLKGSRASALSLPLMSEQCKQFNHLFVDCEWIDTNESLALYQLWSVQ